MTVFVLLYERCSVKTKNDFFQMFEVLMEFHLWWLVALAGDFRGIYFGKASACNDSE
jgi:hypothetical protein